MKMAEQIPESEMPLEPCPCRQSCCEETNIHYDNGFSQCENCFMGCYCND